MTRYRGKYPNRIHTIYSDNGAGLIVRTNAGLRYRVSPRNRDGSRHAPKLGAPIDHYIQSTDYSVTALDGLMATARE